MKPAEFDDLLAANEQYTRTFPNAGIKPRAKKGLGLVTCMDSRIDPLGMLGLRPGDAKILRNAGARVTDDVLRSLVLANHLLGVERVMVVAHTNCAMAVPDGDALHRAVEEAGGPDTRDIRFLEVLDQERALAEDVDRLRAHPYLSGIEAGGFLYDVETGRVRRVC